MLGRIVTHWDDIIGPDMAPKTQPVRLSYRQSKTKKPEFLLEISANSAESTLLRYRVDLILERLNRILGEHMITAIRFVPVTANSTLSRPLKHRKTLTEEQKSGLSHVLDTIEDQEIRERLAELGAAILQDDRS